MENEVSITGIEKGLISKTDPVVVKNLPLDKSKIAVSVSVNEDLESLGLSEQHLNDISIEIARYIIANGGTALYGGDLRLNGFTNYFSELSNQYSALTDNSFHFVNYFALPISKNITKAVLIEFQSKSVGIEIVTPEAGVHVDKNKSYDTISNIEDRYVISQCYLAMRKKMTQDCTARVVVGGRVSGFAGIVPGVLEEAILTFEMSKPLYVIGGFGGVSRLLAQVFEGVTPYQLTNDFQYDSDFRRQFRDYVSDKTKHFDYDQILKVFSENGLKDLSQNNKLTVEENKILFHSTNIHEITYLIMKGLKKLKHH